MHLNTPSRISKTTHGSTPVNFDGSVAVTLIQTGKLLRLPKVLDLVAMQRSAWYERVKDGRAPRPVRLGGSRAVAWREEEILSWIAELPTTEGASA